MGAKGINKGRAAERGVINLLQPILDHCWGTIGFKAPQLTRRGLGFSGQDIIGLEWLALEVKFHAKPHLNEWWKQCLEQAERHHGRTAEPVLAYKTNFQPWRVRMFGCAGQRTLRPCIVDIAWEDFEWWFHDRVMKDVDAECELRSRGS